MSFYAGAVPAGMLAGQANMTKGSKTATENVHLAELLDLYLWRRVPSNIETAAFTAQINATWEDYDIIAALNTALTTDIRLGEAVELLCTLEVIDAGGGADDTFKYANGDTPDGDDTLETIIPTDGVTTLTYGVLLVTDSAGNIKIEISDITEITVVLHLEAYRYVKKVAAA